jgi:ribosomal-protein-alanine N-acetyltransferase
MSITIRWLIRADIDPVMEIERQSFDHPWSLNDLEFWLKKRNVIGMVAEDDADIVRGYVIYELEKTSINLLNFAVDPDYRYQGVGRALMDKMLGKLQCGKRNKLSMILADNNLGGQLFLRQMGFRATKVEKGYYEKITNDAYVFEFSQVLQEVL